MATSTIQRIPVDTVATATPTAETGYTISNYNIRKTLNVVSLFIAISKNSGTFNTAQTTVATIPSSFAPSSDTETALLANSAMNSNGFKAKITSTGNVVVQGAGTAPTWINIVVSYII